MAAQKPNGSLKKFLDSRRVDTRLIGPIERHLLTRPQDKSRRLDVLHPSEIVKNDFCKRAAYFVITTGQKKDDRPGLRLQSIFDEGHAIHHKWQSWIRDGGWLYGKWHCTYCSLLFWETSPASCPECGHGAYLKYEEVPVYDEDLMIAGHADGWVKGLGDDFLIEIKSIGTGTIRMEDPSLLADGDLASAWKNIRRPFSTHVRQGRLYLELARRMHSKGLLDSFPTEMVFIYELKMDQSYKEFVIAADAEFLSRQLDDAFEVAQAVRKELGAPPCSISPTSGCKQCRPYDEQDES